MIPARQALVPPAVAAAAGSSATSAADARMLSMAVRRSARITYPYYTTRGPRDFLAKNPPSIGP